MLATFQPHPSVYWDAVHRHRRDSKSLGQPGATLKTQVHCLRHQDVEHEHPPPRPPAESHPRSQQS